MTVTLRRIRRVLTALSALLLALALLPAPSASAAAWDTAVEKLMEWGVANGYADGEFHPERLITRAQFVAMVNRAYGYNQLSPDMPFRDVADSSWYYDDISIAYNMGYFTGTTPSTANPDGFLSRQQAMTLLAKNLRLDSVPGEVTEFTDGNRFANYSKGYVKAALEKGLITGYSDGTYRPEEYITRGAMAILLYRALGNLINNEGTYELGDVFGNVTVSSPNTTLRDTTISGDLYVTGGLGLGGVTLQNVRTLGNIIVSGTGEAEVGNESVVLRNVEADKLQVDSMTGQYLSLRAEGTTSIHDTSVRTGAFIQDRTPTGQGLLNIALEGAPQDTFTLSGNVESVSNKTPQASLIAAAGTLQTLTMDEEGAGSSLRIDNNATVNTLNLDTATPVTGAGDVDTANITTAGTTMEMLPDTTVIRPGITSRVSGTNMDTVAGQEASEDPRILAGYPKAINIAPTTMTAVFSTNKAGTVYWAISGVADGSITEEELITPAVYGSKALRNGNVRAASSNTEVRANVTGLTSGGDYYLSAIMVDSRGTRSPVKVESFSTPDGTVPAFLSGYPAISNNTYDRNSSSRDRYSAQVMVMANKSCQLYWAIYNENSATPTTGDFRANVLPGSIASGVQDLTRSLPSLIQLTGLLEQTTYDVYLWLTDADFARGSAVRKLTFTTVDGTPPEFVIPLTVNTIRATSLGLTATVNENVTIFWVAVRAGARYPLPPSGSTTSTVPDAEYSRLQISSGMNAVRSGSVSARANTAAAISITGLQAETAYDIWYIARDTAGNYSAWPAGDPYNSTDPNSPRRTCMITANTLDNIPPTVKQEFTRHMENEPDNPYADTNIRLVFSEGIQRISTNERLLDLYQEVTGAATATDRRVAREVLAEALRNTIHLYDRSNPGLPTLVRERNADNENNVSDWVVDYRNVRVTMEDSNLVVLFPTVIETEETGRTSALKLLTGVSYYFELEDLADISTAQNRMPVTRLPNFRTIASQVALQTLSLPSTSYPTGVAEIDMSFSVLPISTAQADPSTTWDMLLWSDTSCEFEMYVRSRPADTPDVYDEPWVRIQNPNPDNPRGIGGRGIVAISSTSAREDKRVGQSLHFNLYNFDVGETPALTNLRDDRVYEYAIRFLEVEGSNQRAGWSQEVHFNVSVVAGSSVELGNLASNIVKERFDAAKQDQSIDELTTLPNLQFRLTRAFLDTEAPTFSSGRPIFNPADVSVEMRLQISRRGTVYYALAPADDTITTRDLSGLVVNMVRGDEVPTSGSDVKVDANGNEVRDENGNSIPLAPFHVSVPPYLEIVNPEYDNTDIKTGSVPITSGTVAVTVSGLIPETDYFAYFVIQGTGQTYSRYVEIFRFRTTEVQRPVITLDLSNPIVNVSSNRQASIDYMVVNYNSAALSTLLTRAFWNNDPTGDADPPAAYQNYRQINSVLQAMSMNLATTDDNGQGSVFDKYATQAYKDQLAEYIRASSSNTAGTIIGVGHGIEVRPGERYVVDNSIYPMSERAQYAFLAVGRSPSGSGDAFRSIYPLTLVDSEAPMVIDVQSTLNMDVINGQVQDTCTGKVSLTFNEYLYHSDDTTSPPTLRQVDRGPLLRTRDDFISIAALVQTSSFDLLSLSTAENMEGRPTLTVDFDFSNAIDGDFLTFSSDLCDQYSNVRSTPLTVSLSIARVRTIVDVSPETGDPIYGYISTPTVNITTAWDARPAGAR